ncbi:MAG: protein-glutamate O-methyltransferase CheR [Thermodesulfovibrionales bacterium]|nr:protein-glutamate O-methyltransferase CheR [Thermodesulfovibrionales bacterium]
MKLLSDRELKILRERITIDFGIAFREEKADILEEFIEERLKITGLSLDEYLSRTLDGFSNRELFLLVSSVTNKETYFFREMPQLEVSIELLKKLSRTRQKLKILSLGCSSGEEVYTLSILLYEKGILFPGREVIITGIDLDPRAVKKAKEAVYTDNSFRNKEIPLKKYFIKEDRFYRIRDVYKKIVDFRTGNILDRNIFLEFMNRDMIFCRNVFIYMTEEAIIKILENIHASLAVDGYLILGSCESITGKTNLFVPEYYNGVVVYRKK